MIPLIGFAAMSIATFTTLAMSHPLWKRVMGEISKDLATGFLALELGDALTWGGLLTGRTDEALEQNARELLQAFGLSADDPTEQATRVQDCLRLHRVAAGISSAWAGQTARVPDCKIAADVATARKRELEDSEAQRQTRLRTATSTDHGPWRGKAYRRLEALGDPRAREKAEQQDRAK